MVNVISFLIGSPLWRTTLQEAEEIQGCSSVTVLIACSLSPSLCHHVIDYTREMFWILNFTLVTSGPRIPQSSHFKIDADQEVQEIKTRNPPIISATNFFASIDPSKAFVSSSHSMN